MSLYAVAARAVCADPGVVEHVTQVLEAIGKRLVPPEAHAAQECGRMWQLFARVARLPKDTLRQEAGRAFCRDLDALGQRLDLPPLAEWADLPAGVDSPDYASPSPQEVPAERRATPLTLEEVQRSARAFAEASPQGHVSATDAAQLVAALAAGERTALFAQMVGKGQMGRSDTNLLVRFLAKGEPPGPHDTVLIEVLERLGSHLAKPV